MSYDTNLRAAVAALIKAKGRHHTGIEYARLVEAFNADAIGRAITDPIDSIDYKLMFERCRAEKQSLMERLRQLAPNEFVYPANLPSALPIPAPDPRYDARCALMDKTDWSAA